MILDGRVYNLGCGYIFINTCCQDHLLSFQLFLEYRVGVKSLGYSFNNTASFELNGCREGKTDPGFSLWEAEK